MHRNGEFLVLVDVTGSPLLCLVCFFAAGVDNYYNPAWDCLCFCVGSKAYCTDECPSYMPCICNVPI